MENPEVHHAESLNDQPVFIRALADIIAHNVRANKFTLLWLLLEYDRCAARVFLHDTAIHANG